jgi:hypothetical protein
VAKEVDRCGYRSILCPCFVQFFTKEKTTIFVANVLGGDFPTVKKKRRLKTSDTRMKKKN